MKDTQKDEPVSKSLDDEIADLVDEAEGSDDENTENESEPEETEADEPEPEPDAEPEPDEVDEEAEEGEEPDEDGEGDADPDLVASDEADEDKLEPPHHWSEVDKETFNKQTRGAQEYILKRHKEMEGHFTRKNQEMSDIQRQYDAIRDALRPYEQEFASKGLDHAGAVRQLAHWDHAIKTGGKPAILQLAQAYGVDLSEDSDEPVDPVLRQTQNQLSEIKRQIARQNEEAQQRERQEIFQKIQAFETQTDDKGQLLHPHFKELEETITALYNAGEALGPPSLEDAYNKALLLNPALAAKQPKAEIVPKINPADKVKQAKKAATGVRSSGAVGKKERSKMTLEEEIASNMNR
jgi:hypothetical protein